MPSQPTIAARHAQVILDAAAHVGIAPATLLAAANIDASALTGSEARIALSAQTRLWSAAVRLTGDEAFAVRIGGSLSPGRYGVLEPLILACPTFGEAIRRFMRFERLSADGAVTTMVTHGSDAIMSYGPRVPGHECSPYGVEVTFAAMLSLARGATGRKIAPRAVRLRRAAPPDIREHERVFGILPQFEAPDDALVFDLELLSLPFRTADPLLADTLDRFASQQVAMLPAVTDELLAPRLRAWLGQAIASGSPSISVAARALAVSERTLQRKLQFEGTSFADVIDDVRKDRALSQTLDGRVSLDVVALLAGFSEKRAFYRAFRRWTGVTPAVYRSSAG